MSTIIATPSAGVNPEAPHLNIDVPSVAPCKCHTTDLPDRPGPTLPLSDVATTAEKCGWPNFFLRNLCARQVIPHYLIGGEPFFDEAETMRYVRSCHVDAKPEPVADVMTRRRQRNIRVGSANAAAVASASNTTTRRDRGKGSAA